MCIRDRLKPLPFFHLLAVFPIFILSLFTVYYILPQIYRVCKTQNKIHTIQMKKQSFFSSFRSFYLFIMHNY